MADYTILIPVFNETDALSFSKFYFDRLNLRPIYVLDSKKIDRRDEVERIVGQEVAIYQNPGLVAESNFEKFAALSPTDWIIRIDCDETPTAAMLDHAQKFVTRGKGSVKGYERRQMRWHQQSFQAVKRGLAKDVQFRLFDRRKVKFEHKIHTPGYKVPLLQMWPAPLSARLYHLQFLFESPEQRAKKGERYRSLGQARKFDAWFETPIEAFPWEPLDDPFLTESYKAWLGK